MPAVSLLNGGGAVKLWRGRVGAHFATRDATFRGEPRTRALDPFQKWEWELRFAVSISAFSKTQKNGGRPAVISDDQRAPAANHVRNRRGSFLIVHFHSSHRSISSPPIRTPFRSLTPTARIRTTGSGSPFTTCASCSSIVSSTFPGSRVSRSRRCSPASGGSQFGGPLARMTAGKSFAIRSPPIPVPRVPSLSHCHRPFRSCHPGR